jgi:uncharacterized protein (DUF362 family)
MSDKEKVRVAHFTPENCHGVFERATSQVLSARHAKAGLIAIKINLCDYRRAESGATTSPAMLGALLEVLRAHYSTATLAVLENDATSLDVRSAYKLLGFVDVARRHGAELLNAREGEWVKKPVPSGRVFEELEVPEVVDRCDLFINFTKLKTNGLTKMTGCLKNLFGLLRTKRKVIHHARIHEVILDINRVIRPDLCLVDGHIAQEGIGGPAFGKPKRCDLLVYGRDPVAVDSCCCRIMGFRPLSVEYIKLAHQAGLGAVDYELVTDIPNFDYRTYRFEFNHLEYFLRNLLRNRAGAAA